MLSACIVASCKNRETAVETIYTDYQATTPVDPRVVDAMAPFWNDQFGNPHAEDHVVGWHAAKSVRGAVEAVSGLIGADPDEIFITSGATEANNLALLGLARKDRNTRTRRRILVSAIEHKCVLAAARAAARQSELTLETIPVDRFGFVDLDYLSAQVDERVLVVSVMAVNNEIGTIQNIPEISSVLEPYGILFHCDAAQAPCAMNVSNLAMHADLVSLSSHKFYGPQGIGALYIRRALQKQIEPLIYGGGQQAGIRSGTVPLALAVGLGTAAAIINSDEGLGERVRIGSLRDKFVDVLRSQDILMEVNGPWKNGRHPGNINLCFPGLDSQDILSRLQPQLAASTGSACTTGIPEQSHVLHALGLSRRQVQASVRFGFGRFSNCQDVIKAARLVAAAVSESDG